MQCKKIMIVDDDKDFLEELKNLLALNGYSVIAIDDGDAALQAAHMTRPDVILLDIKMKGIYGFQIAERLKRSPKTANIPIFAMSGCFTRKEDVQLMDLCGMKMCFVKPINTNYMIDTIDSLLRKKR